MSMAASFIGAIVLLALLVSVADAKGAGLMPKIVSVQASPHAETGRVPDSWHEDQQTPNVHGRLPSPHSDFLKGTRALPSDSIMELSQEQNRSAVAVSPAADAQSKIRSILQRLQINSKEAVETIITDIGKQTSVSNMKVVAKTAIAKLVGIPAEMQAKAKLDIDDIPDDDSSWDFYGSAIALLSWLPS
mmetsp:Transcript_78422/g.196962  ORF Transcript_78422/g.196962 Transcript_78422/m.196962 type:complete len:189 (-) Transcript_78422:176-742(-)